MEKRHVLTMQGRETRSSRPRRHSSLAATLMLGSGDGQAVGHARVLRARSRTCVSPTLSCRWMAISGVYV